MSVPMVARASEIGELAAAWSAVARPRVPRRHGHGGTPTAVITGPAGTGKSRLVAAAVDAFDPPPQVVLSGRARVHSPAPYDWLAAVLSGRDTVDLAIPPDALAWLGQHPDADGGGQARRRYAPDALLRLAVSAVRTLVGAGPAVLVVEDLHALDPASLNLVAELAAAPELPALLLVTSRPADAAISPPLAARTLARLVGVRQVVRQQLRGFTDAEVAELLRQVYPDAVVDADLARAVTARTAGNPYQLMELITASRGTDPEALVADHAMPETPVELTAREREVLACLAGGMSNKQVARHLGISVRTVTVHVSSLLRKTGSASRTEAALWAVHHRKATAPMGADVARR